jgi:acetyl-CoA decarbonylase/synthase complex subunit gamma
VEIPCLSGSDPWLEGMKKFEKIGLAPIRLDNQVKTREIVIPGFVSQISGELEENLPGWKVLVGPQDAADLESFIKARLS